MAILKTMASRPVELQAMQKRLAGARTNKMMKKPMMRQRTKMNFSGKV